jgi:hypothetical protein
MGDGFEIWTAGEWRGEEPLEAPEWVERTWGALGARLRL